ncbi:MAG: RagB/SusD family nutrient uptake outer membrane protein [Williamsia sp.]|nr:RagB/SusD family nutrient uptake outer membrane protein [Williamsia sp.]
MKKVVVFSLFALLANLGCTKVDENVYDRYAAQQFFADPKGPDIALASVYAQMPQFGGGDNGYYDLNNMCTDEQVVPHRVSGDWGPENAYLYTRAWLPSLGQINTAWNACYNSIYLANLAISQLESTHAAAAKIAEVKVLRAWFYYLLIDDFGDVPFYTDNNITTAQLKTKSRADVYSWIVSEVTANADLLPETKGGVFYGRFNKWAAYMFLAKVYLNAGVYTGTPKWTECLAACNKIASAGYTLHAGAANASSPLGYKYFELFGDVCPDDETILAIWIKRNVVGNNVYALRSLNGPHAKAVFGYSGWNGTIVPEETYNKYDPNDIRAKQFLLGPQPGGVTYTPKVASLINPGAGINEGVRDVKFYPVAPNDGSGESNDFPIYRYADVLLMQAECNVRLGNADAAKPLIDQVRVRAGLSPLAAAPTLANIYDERGFELNWEGHRRQDMIRFGTFTLAHGFVPAVDQHWLIFPIPTRALTANTNLKQNPGY